MAYRVSSKATIQPLEPKCKKRVYNSPEEADAMIRHIKETRRVPGIRAYQCSMCGFWHLTSKP